MTVQRLTIKAEFIRPGDILGTDKVLWAINDYLRRGYIEVRLAPLEAHNTKFILKTKSVEIVRLTIP